MQARLRHASAKTTLDVYGHLFPDEQDRTRTFAELDEASDRFAGWLRGSGASSSLTRRSKRHVMRKSPSTHQFARRSTFSRSHFPHRFRALRMCTHAFAVDGPDALVWSWEPAHPVG